MKEWILTESPARFVVSAKRDAREQALYELYDKQLGCFWTTAAVDIQEDVKQWDRLSSDDKYYIKQVLAFFAGFDGLVNENLAQNFLVEVQVNEARLFYGMQIFMEGIHGEMYTQMLQTFVKDQDELNHLMSAMENIPAVKEKADWAKKWTNPETATFAERLVAFACVEGIMFSGSFCAIYWLKKRSLLVNSLGQSNEYIARDEGLHCQFACTLYSMLEHTRLTVERVSEIICEAVDHELQFVKHSLPVGLIGMNANLMSAYVKFTADCLFVALGYPKHYYEENPFDWMELISLQGKTNFFEKRVSEYQHLTGSVDGGEKVFSLTEDF